MSGVEGTVGLEYVENACKQNPGEAVEGRKRGQDGKGTQEDGPPLGARQGAPKNKKKHTVIPNSVNKISGKDIWHVRLTMTRYTLILLQGYISMGTLVYFVYEKTDYFYSK